MEEKNIWLIRTKQNKILGPVSKSKILDLLDKGALTSEDEVCSGNGYWFWIKEAELVDQFLKGDLKQDFNPVSEAETKIAFDLNVKFYEDPLANLTKKNESQIIAPPVHLESNQVEKPESPDLKIEIGFESNEVKKENNLKVEAGGDEVIIPSQEDLEYPDMDSIKSAPTPSPSSNREDLNFSDIASDNISLEVNSGPSPEKKTNQIVDSNSNSNEEAHFPEQDDLEYPDMGNNVVSLASKQTPSNPVEPPSAAKIEVKTVENHIEDDEIDNLLVAEQSLESQIGDELDDVGNATNTNIIIGKKSSKDSEEEAEVESDNVAVIKEMPKPQEKSGGVKKKKRRKKAPVEMVKPMPKRNDRVIMYAIALMVAVILYGIYYYYTTVLGNEIITKLNTIVPTANAQTVQVAEKKNSI